MSRAGARRARAGRLRRAARALLAPLGWPYWLGSALHRLWWRIGPRRPVRLPCKVVSVGNLTVGGSGKTPVAAWIAAGLRRRGLRVALASRGYGRRGGEAIEVVSDGARLLGRVETCGDEPLLLARLAPGVPVLVGARRDAVGWRAVSAFGTEVLLLDDGFQHHRLARDLDLVLLPAALPLARSHGLPVGPLREPPSALRRADAVGAVAGPLAERDEALVARCAPRARRFQVARRPTRLRPLGGGRDEPATWLAGRAVGLICALARPQALRASVEALGARVVAERRFRDHHVYSPGDVADLAADAPLWITTEKDAPKLLPAWLRGADVRVLGEETQVVEGEAFLDWLEQALHARAAGRDPALPAVMPRPA